MDRFEPDQFDTIASDVEACGAAVAPSAESGKVSPEARRVGGGIGDRL